MVLTRIVKPKNQRAKRALVKREPKLVENDKQAMVIRGGHTSETVTTALKEVYMLKKPNAIMFKRKNMLRPFEDGNPIEHFAKKYDASLFLFGSHSKKRPHNLVLGRLYDGGILDMIELGIEKFKSLNEFQSPKCALATKPCLIFSGDQFDQEHPYRRLKSLLIDFFRGPVVENIRLQGLEHVLQFTAMEGKVYVRSYVVQLKKSGTRIPRVELEEMGPALDLVLRRTKLASDDLYRQACKVPRAAKVGKKKNVSMDAFRTQHGRIHMQKQDLGTLQTRKMKGLKRAHRNLQPTAGGKRTRAEGDDDTEMDEGQQVEGELQMDEEQQ